MKSNYLFNYLCFVCMLLVVFSCQKDELFKEKSAESTYGPHYQINKKSYTELSQENKFNRSFSTVFKKMKPKGPNVQGKTIMEEQYGFTIDSTRIHEFLAEDYVSYTFLIHRETADSTFFENLVVTVDSTDVPKAYTIKYTLNSEPVYISGDDAYTLDAETELTPINYNDAQAKTALMPDGCTIATLMCPYEDDHPAGQACIDEDRGNLYWAYDSSNCFGIPGGGGGGLGVPGGIKGGAGPDDDSDEEENDQPPIIISPVLPEGQDKDKPCPGDPLKNPEIAPQHGSSGAKGALFGCTRYGNDGCQGEENRDERHNGIDIKNEYGNPVYAMFDGTVHSSYYQPNGAGYVTRIRSVLPNGEIIIYQYFHMQQDDRLTIPGTIVEAGDIVGYQGASGNLGPAIASGGVDSHVHIKIGLYDGTGDSNNYSNFKNNTVDPANYMHTTFEEKW